MKILRGIVLSSLIALSLITVVKANSSNSISPASGRLSGGEKITISHERFFGEKRRTLGQVVDYSEGKAHAAAVLDDGKIAAWGDDDASIDPHSARLITLPSRAVKVEARGNSTVALTEQGGAYYWGDGRVEPKPFALPAGYRAYSVKLIGDDNAMTAIFLLCADNEDCTNGASLVAEAALSDITTVSVIASTSFNDRVREISTTITPPYYIAAITSDTAYVWQVGKTPRQLGSRFNVAPQSGGLDHIASGWVSQSEALPEQMFLIANDTALHAYNGNGVYLSLPPLPAASPIQQLANDGRAGHFVLTQDGDVFMWYSGRADTTQAAWTMLPSPQRDKIVKLIPFDRLNEYQAGSIMGMSATGRLYTLHTSLRPSMSPLVDITPDLTIGTGEMMRLIKYIQFGGIKLDSSKFTYKSDNEIELTVPKGLHPGTVSVEFEDLNGQTWPIGEYTYNTPPPIGGNTLGDDSAGSTSQKKSLKPFTPHSLLSTDSLKQTKTLLRKPADSISVLRSAAKPLTLRSYGGSSRSHYAAPNTGVML